MKRNDFLLNLFAALAFLLLGAAGGYVYEKSQAIQRAIEVQDKPNYKPADLKYIAVGETTK